RLAEPRPTGGAFEMLEPCEGRLSRTVLRGLGASNGPRLPDRRSLYRGFSVVLENSFSIVVLHIRRGGSRTPLGIFTDIDWEGIYVGK
ncbi:MAG: hypothetical protein OEW09_17715, partial [Anaerolineae bacterium]|nr:hypothetical protein [Anaerolineae bacterium]